MHLTEKISTLQKLISTHLPQFPFNKLEVFHGKERGYRMRCEFGIYHENQPYRIHHVVRDPITKERIFCNANYDIACPLINKLMPFIEEFCQKHYTFSHRLFQVEYLTTTTLEVIVSLLFHRKIDNEGEDLEIAHKLQKFLMKKNLNNEAPINIILRARKNKIIVGNYYICERLEINKKNYSLYQVENSFSQPNAEVNEMMLNYVAKHTATTNDLLELYCGVGNFTLALASCCRRMLATEVNKQAVDFVYRNLEANQISNVAVGRISAEEFVKAINKERPFNRLAHIDLDSYNFDTVFVDPPRAGLDSASCDMISRFKNITYVSCNPHTLLSNLEYLCKKYGFKVQKLALFDQFPQTPHMESIAILTKE